MNPLIEHVAPIRPDSHQVGRPTVRKIGDRRWAVTWVTPTGDGNFLAWTRVRRSHEDAVSFAARAPRLTAVTS